MDDPVYVMHGGDSPEWGLEWRRGPDGSLYASYGVDMFVVCPFYDWESDGYSGYAARFEQSTEDGPTWRKLASGLPSEFDAMQTCWSVACILAAEAWVRRQPDLSVHRHIKEQLNAD